MCFIAKSCTASVSMSVPTSPVAQRSHARARLNSATPLHSLPRQQPNIRLMQACISRLLHPKRWPTIE